MSFTFACPHCQRRLEAEDEWTGLEIECPKCEGLIEVPSKPGSGSRPAPTAAESTKLCPFCAEPIKAAAIKCRHCGSDINPNSANGPRSDSNWVVLSVVILVIYAAFCWINIEMNEDMDNAMMSCFGLSILMSIGMGVSKRRTIFGIMLGIAAGPIGLIILAFTPPAKPSRSA